MAKKVCTTKLKRELKAFNASPPAHIPAVSVNEANILEWHFLFEGPPDSPFLGGFYVGKLIFPADYPFAPPSISLLTPSGRFKPGSKICMSMSDFHPESWNPSWSVATILVGLLSFMMEDGVAFGTIATSEAEKKQLAAESRDWILRQPKAPCPFAISG
ncbi:hypothetical protein WJX73_003718 [Symbiochloris irregularis]|uniref:UBC core domain-containing protein n=1 Tax=Symbiochloris irregularis TaxID=706552 RepID=A0AAW1NT14_9CHLO